MFYIVGISNQIKPPEARKLNFSNDFLDYRTLKSINWYRNNITYVDSSNVLCRLIDSFAMPEGMDEEYIDTYIYRRAFSHGNSFGLTSDQNIGKIHYGNFYGPLGKEVILMVDNRWDWNYVKANWINLCPLRVLRHDQTHVSFNILGKKNYIENENLSILEIDINLLHMQYEAWRRHHRNVKMVNPQHKLPNVGYFVGMVVLPNTIPSHLNQVLINKFTLLTDTSMVETMDYMGVPFTVQFNENELDRNVEDVGRRLKMNNANVMTYANGIRGINKETALSFQDTPNVLLNRQNRWAYTLAFSRFLRHCLRAQNIPDKLSNKVYLERFKRENRALAYDKVFTDFRISDLYPYFEEEIEYLYTTV